MSLVNILSVELRPDRRRRYLELFHELAEHAKNRQDPFHWEGYETRFGRSNMLHFVRAAEDFSGFAAGGEPEAMLDRVLGQKQASDWRCDADECIVARRNEISVDRPELSYPPESTVGPAPFAVVTLAQARPGAQDACEELIRKVAEAIPKLEDSARIVTYQTVLGDLSQYWTVRPLEGLADLDRQLPAAELLTQAFGPAEGGLIFRSGLEAMARVERELVAYRPEISHPS